MALGLGLFPLSGAVAGTSGRRLDSNGNGNAFQNRRASFDLGWRLREA